VVGKLRRAGALAVVPAAIIVANPPIMAEIAGFDENYLHRRSPPQRDGQPNERILGESLRA
jgi:hypothetical protein